MDQIISNEVLNAILLERQWISQKFNGTPLELIKSHGAVQTQERFSGEEFLRSRGFDSPKLLDQLRRDNKAVKATLHRCTVHTLALDDFMLWQPLYAEKFENFLTRKGVKVSPHWRAQVAGILGAGQYKAREIEELLFPLFPLRESAFLIRGSIGLIRLPGKNGEDNGGLERWTLLPGWEPKTPDELLLAKQDLVRRYLQAFGPARISDFASWSGLTGAAQVFKSIEDELWAGKDEQGKKIYDLEYLSRESSSVMPRYVALPAFDNIVLAYGERARIANFSQEQKNSFFDSAMAPLLVDGQVVATWISRTRAGQTRILLKEIKPVSTTDKEKLEEALAHLLSPERKVIGDFKWVNSFLGA